MTRTSFVWALLVASAASTASCAAILGFEGEYTEGLGGAAASSGGSGGDTASGGSGGATTAGQGSGGAATGGGVSPGCDGLPAKCGPKHDEDCCSNPIVTGGSFVRDNNAQYPAAVSPFLLDRFEVTVGRFRRFVNAYPQSKPAADAGKHPKIAGSGWNTFWDGSLPATQDQLIGSLKTNCFDMDLPTWTDSAGANEEKPINCLTWFEAFAFCAWDGGRLPTDLEWNYAAAGGALQRPYPWGSATPDISYAVYNCIADGSGPFSCTFTDIADVGSRSPKGDGYWTHADLAGSMWEWLLDVWDSSYPATCSDCANVAASGSRVMRGGGWPNNDAIIGTDYSEQSPPEQHAVALGVRCAKDVP
jgi:formylglycine-generating enzyme required for sulfatase activity